MARRRAFGGVAQAVAHGRELCDCPVQLVGLAVQFGAVDPRPSIVREHGADGVEREARMLAERDQCQALDYVPVEQASEAVAADGANEAPFLVVPQRRGRQAGLPRNLPDIDGADGHMVTPEIRLLT